MGQTAIVSLSEPTVIGQLWAAGKNGQSIMKCWVSHGPFQSDLRETNLYCEKRSDNFSNFYEKENSQRWCDP